MKVSTRQRKATELPPKDAPLSRSAVHCSDGADARHTVAGLLVALGLGQLDKDREAHDDLTAQLERPFDELQSVELDVADASRSEGGGRQLLAVN